MSPAVSVITPVWNAAATLGETVASVRAQGFPDWEMLVVDDGSTDASLALARALAAEDPRIRVLAQGANAGAAAARNRGIREAAGRFIAFLDADDLWRPEKLARQLGFMRAHGHALSFTAYRRIAADGTPLKIVRPPARVAYGDLLSGNRIGCLTAVYDTAAFGKVEMPPFPPCEDYALWLRLLRGGATGHGLSEVLADYRVRPGSASADKRRVARANWRIWRESEALPRARAARAFAGYALRGLRQALSRG